MLMRLQQMGQVRSVKAAASPPNNKFGILSLRYLEDVRDEETVLVALSVSDCGQLASPIDGAFRSDLEDCSRLGLRTPQRSKPWPGA